MQLTRLIKGPLRPVLSVPLCAAILTCAQAQVAPTEPVKETEKTAPQKRTAAATDAKIASTEEPASKRSDEEEIRMSPFVVTAEGNSGYRGGRTMSGTRLNSDLEDIAAPLTVITKQQLQDFAAVDINDIFASEVSTEGTRTYTANFNDGKADVDSVALAPETANRVRGIAQANISVGNFAASSLIPIDTYNIDAVEISRGPNSSIFGVGEASGTVNLVPTAANLTREITKVGGSISSYGTTRATIDLNRPLLKNMLAVRINALEHRGEFIRKPSYDDTRRIQYSATYRPFRQTTIRASYEKFKQEYSRANSSMPRELMSLWNAVGRPSWDPTTNTWTVTDPNTGAKTTGTVTPTSNNTATAFPANVWLVGYGSARVRPSAWIDDGQIQFLAPTFWTDTARHEVVTFGLPNRYNVPSQYWDTLPYSAIRATDNKAFYDYENINLAALNYGSKDAEITKVEVEQFFLNTQRHVLAAQLGFFKESIDHYQRTFVGNGGDGVSLYIQPDVNTKYPDGTPNPHYGAPYISALAPQTYRNPVKTETLRANVVYQLDLTQEKNFLRFLGKHKILGYGEKFEKTHSVRQLRYVDQISEVYSWLQPSIRNNNSSVYTARYYLGDASGGNVDYASSAPDLSGRIRYRRYGSATDRAQGWYDESVPITTQYFALGMQQLQTEAQGFVLQNYFWKDRIIPTWGRRRDTLRTRGNAAEPASARDASGLSTNLDWLGDFESVEWDVVNKATGARKNIGYTDTKGIVVKPLSWLSLSYNQSNSFKPDDYAIDFQGNPLPNSGGTSKDYSIRIALFDRKLFVKLGKFETFSKDSRRSAINTVASRITLLDFDNDVNVNGSRVDLEDYLVNQYLALELGSPDLIPNATQAQADAALAKAHQLMKLDPARIALLRTYTRSVTADTASEGYELELDYNPNRFFSVKLNGSRSETIYSNFGRTWVDYRNERLELWKTIRGPYDGGLWWTTRLINNDTPESVWIGQNEAPMKVSLALDGKPVPQYAKYKANLLTRYNLAGLSQNKVLKNITVGGKVSWNSKTAVGFYSAAPESDGRAREYDANRPIWEKGRYYVDAFANYNFTLFKNRVRGQLQFNVKNVMESGSLRPYQANPDGTMVLYRIIDPREFIVGVNFDF